VPAPPRVALATCSALPDLHPDEAPLLPALGALGLDAEAAVWDDPAVDWASYDLVVVRSTWDYVPRHAQFLAWTRSVPRLANPADVLAWSADKRYLRTLAQAGVPVVPTTFLGPGDAYAPPAGEHVVKPLVSAGARDTARYAPGEDSTGHVRRLLEAGRGVMVQPYLRSIDVEGETALLFFGGRHSHTARKAPVLVPDLDDPDEVEITAHVASEAQLAVAEAALAAVPFDGPLLYARVDLAPGPDGSPVVLELELAEPGLFLATSPGAAERFAAVVAERVRPAAR
jgi:glutathione synthase/RimK-type ligase-like ATP-grasp enzyme